MTATIEQRPKKQACNRTPARLTSGGSCAGHADVVPEVQRQMGEEAALGHGPARYIHKAKGRVYDNLQAHICLLCTFTSVYLGFLSAGACS
jgi:hypothetical protein